MKMNNSDVCIPKSAEVYLRKVLRRLNLPKSVRNRVLSDLRTTICARLERGESCEEILDSFGSPRDAAAALCAEMDAYTYRKSPLRFLFAALSIVTGGWLLIDLGTTLLFRHRLSHVSAIGGADGPTSIFVTVRSTGQISEWIPVLLFAVGLIGYFLLSRLHASRREA